jgi:hypothetical protein
MKKKNFRFGQMVKITNTGSELDGSLVEVVGVAMEHVLDTYIVMMSKPRETSSIRMGKFLALSMTEACLEEIG